MPSRRGMRPIITTSRTLKGKSLGISCSTTAMVFAASRAVIAQMSTPSTSIEPAVGCAER
ncbi:hypothetical protein D3C72_1967890 [compost metagenome]